MPSKIRPIQYPDGSAQSLLIFGTIRHFLLEQELLELFFWENFELRKSIFDKILLGRNFENSDKVKINQFLDNEENEVGRIALDH